MMTCGSLRSGMASSGTPRTANNEPTTMNAVKMNTSARWVAQYSMIRPTMARLSVLVTGGGLSPHTGDRRLEAALGIDQERGARDYRVACREPLQDLDAVPGLVPDRDHARLEQAARAGQEHVAVLPG